MELLGGGGGGVFVCVQDDVCAEWREGCFHTYCQTVSPALTENLISRGELMTTTQLFWNSGTIFNLKNN